MGLEVTDCQESRECFSSRLEPTTETLSTYQDIEHRLLDNWISRFHTEALSGLKAR